MREALSLVPCSAVAWFLVPLETCEHSGSLDFLKVKKMLYFELPFDPRSANISYALAKATGTRRGSLLLSSPSVSAVCS